MHTANKPSVDSYHAVGWIVVDPKHVSMRQNPPALDREFLDAHALR